MTEGEREHVDGLINQLEDARGDVKYLEEQLKKTKELLRKILHTPLNKMFTMVDEIEEFIK